MQFAHAEKVHNNLYEKKKFETCQLVSNTHLIQVGTRATREEIEVTHIYLARSSRSQMFFKIGFIKN